MKDFKKEGMFIDDIFSVVGLNDTEVMAYVLSTIMDKQLTVAELTVQGVEPNYDKRSARFDVEAVDDAGRVYDVEVQRAKVGAKPERARYNSALIDTNRLKTGENPADLPESYIVFITETDIFGDGLQAYHIDRVIQETGKPFNDRAHIIYVNVENANVSTELGKMLHDFKCADPSDMYSTILAKRMTEVKNNPEDIRKMKNYYETYEQNAFKNGFNNGFSNGFDNGFHNGVVEIITGMLQKGYSEEEIRAIYDDDKAIAEAKQKLDANL